MEQPKVSVLISAYNEKIKWVNKSVDSILNQTYSNFEVIFIIDNPEYKELINVAKEYEKKDSRIKVIINPENKGLVYSLNKALNEANGDLIARLDADDISLPDRFEKQVEFLNKNKDVDILGTSASIIDENDNIVKDKISIICEHNKIKKILKYTNIFFHPSLMIRKKMLLEIGGYREVKYAEDYDMITRAISLGKKVANLGEALIKYRVRSSSVCSTNTSAQRNSAFFVAKNYIENNEIIKENNYEYFNCSELTIIKKIRWKINRIKYRLLNFIYKF